MCYSQNTFRVLRTPDTLSFNIQNPTLHSCSEKGFAILIVVTEISYLLWPYDIYDGRSENKFAIHIFWLLYIQL